MTIDLANGTSFVLSGISYDYYPRRSVRIEITLIQTPGDVAVDPETIDMFGAHHAIYFSVMDPLAKATCLALIGRNTATIGQWITNEWQKYLTDIDTCETQLKPIFDYANLIGLKT